MDWLAILERYGIATVVAGAMCFMVKRQNAYIQDQLSKEIRSSFDTLTGIVIKLIDQQKKMQLEQKGLENSYKTLVEIIASLSGNGLKDRFLRMQEKNENKKY